MEVTHMTILGNGVLTLSCGPAACTIVPRAGGALAGFWWERNGKRFDWLRSAPPRAIADSDAEQMACFPLVPYANRIRDGRFLFCGREVVEPPPVPEARHALHGHGWRRDWLIRERGEDRLVLEYRHAAAAWPWDYRARQTFTLTPEALVVGLEVKNLSDDLMPAGLGFHPSFPRRPAAVVRAAASGVWLADAECLPTEKTAVPPAWDLAEGRPLADLALDHVFTGWNGRAVIAWPEEGASLALEACHPLLSFLAVETRPEAESFCLKPVSHCADAINLAREGVPDTGLRVLAPGARRSARLTLRPHWN
jgi:aldose 1-epimerase